MARGLRGSAKGKRDDEDNRRSGSSAPSEPVSTASTASTTPTDSYSPSSAQASIQPDSTQSDSNQPDSTYSEAEFHYEFTLDPRPNGTCNVIAKRVMDGITKTEEFESKELANQFIIECQNKIASELEKHRQNYAEERARITPISSPGNQTVVPAPVDDSALPAPLTNDELVLVDSKGKYLHIIPELSGLVRKWLGDSDKVASFAVRPDGSIIIVSTPTFQKGRFYMLNNKAFFTQL